MADVRRPVLELHATGDFLRSEQHTAAGHIFDNGVCLTCVDDEPDGPMDEDAQALLAAIAELCSSTRAAFVSGDHPRNPKGSAGGGRFRSNVDKLKDAIKAHKAGGGKGADPFGGFDREQLRRVAKARGIELKRGEDRDSIAKKLLDHLDDEPKPVEKTPDPDPLDDPPPPKKRAPQKKAAPKPVAATVAPAAAASPPPQKRVPVKTVPHTPAAALAGSNDRYNGPQFTFTSEKKRKIADELLALRAQQEQEFDWDRSIKVDDLEEEADFTRIERQRLAQLGLIGKNTEGWRKAQAPGMSQAELHADMERRSREAWAGKPVAVRVTPNALADILDDGRFKSQFETGTSKGELDPNWRGSMEARWFGIPENADPKTRPIYGYLAVDGIRPGRGGNSEEYLDQYGDVQVVLKDSVKDRTTAMWGDSLNIPDYGIPEPLNNPTWRSYSLPQAGIANAELKLLDRDVNSPQWRQWNFVETQVHGGVSTGDIAEVVFGKEPSKALRSQLDRAGVPWRVA